MIVDFAPWREEVGRQLDRLKEGIAEYSQAPSSAKGDVEVEVELLDAANFKLERSLAYLAISLRKMDETVEYADTGSLDVSWKDRRALPFRLENRSASYRVRTGRSITLNAKRLFDRILHSKNIEWFEEDSGFSGFWLGSDKDDDGNELLVLWNELFDLAGPLVSPKNEEA